MIRIDCIWLASSAVGASDLHGGGIDKLLAQVVHGFALGAQAHRRADRLKVLVVDGVAVPEHIHLRHTCA